MKTYKCRKGAIAYKAGLEAEKDVILFLEKLGYKLLAHRYRTILGEIDLLVANDEWLLAIEVKHRRSLYEGAYALSKKQARRLLAAFDYIIQLKPEWLRPNIRFDVIITDWSGQIEHIKDAIRLS
nr:YraN family protein [Aristophania vespae]